MIRIFLFSLLIVSSVGLNAQRYGHMNFNAFLTSLTDTRKADIDLEEYQNTLVAEGQAMAEKFKNNLMHNFHKSCSIAGELKTQPTCWL